MPHVQLVSGGCGSGDSIDVVGWGDKIKLARWGKSHFSVIWSVSEAIKRSRGMRVLG